MYKSIFVFSREFAPGTVRSTGEWVRGIDSKHYAISNVNFHDLLRMTCQSNAYLMLGSQPHAGLNRMHVVKQKESEKKDNNKISKTCRNSTVTYHYLLYIPGLNTIKF